MKLQRVLHVDDDEDIRVLTRATLEIVGGFAVEQCATGYEAIDQATVFKPDLILLDVMMPGIDGEQTFLRLRDIESLDHVPIVFATAKVHAESIVKLHAIGAAGVVSKPFDPIVLPNTLRAIWERFNGVKCR